MEENDNKKSLLKKILIIICIILVIVLIVFGIKAYNLYKINRLFGNDYCIYNGAHLYPVSGFPKESYCKICNKFISKGDYSPEICNDCSKKYSRCKDCGKRIRTDIVIERDTSNLWNYEKPVLRENGELINK